MKNFDLMQVLPNYGQEVTSVSGKKFRLYDFTSLSPNNPMYGYNPAADIGLGGKIGLAFNDTTSIVQAFQQAWSQAMQWENSQVSETAAAEVQANDSLGINSDLTGFTAQGQSSNANPQLEVGAMPVSSEDWTALIRSIPENLSMALGFVSQSIGLYNANLSSDIGLFNAFGGYKGLKDRSVKNLQSSADSILEGLTDDEKASFSAEDIIDTAMKSEPVKRLRDQFRTKGFKNVMDSVKRDYGSSEEFAKYVRDLQVSKSEAEVNPLFNAQQSSIRLWRQYNETLLTCQAIADIRSNKTRFRRDEFEAQGFDENGEFSLERSARMSALSVQKRQSDAMLGALQMSDGTHLNGQGLLQGSMYNDLLNQAKGSEANYYQLENLLSKAKTQYRSITRTIKQYQNSPDKTLQLIGDLNGMFFYQVTPWFFNGGFKDFLRSK